MGLVLHNCKRTSIRKHGTLASNILHAARTFHHSLDHQLERGLTNPGARFWKVEFNKTWYRKGVVDECRFEVGVDSGWLVRSTRR